MNKKKEILKCSKSSIKKIALTSVFVFFIQFLFSQDTLSSVEVEEVIIAASGIEQNPIDVGRSISIITQDEIQKSVYSNVSEILSEKEGIFIIGIGQTPGSLQSIYLRGTGINQTVILIDGVRITDPSTVDNAVNLAELSLANVERIEIVRGTHSTLYGSSAIGGVVNIITKKGLKEGINAYANVKAGTFGKSTREISENLYLNFTSKSGLYASGEIFNTNVKGLDATIDSITDPTLYNNRDNDDFNKLDWIGKLGYKTGKWDVFASYKSITHKNEIDAGAFTDDENNTVNFNRDLLTYQASYKPFDNFHLKFSGGYTEMKRVAVNDSSVVDEIGTYDHSYSKDSYFGTVLNNELQANYKIKGLSILFGLGNYQESMTSDSYYINTAWTYTSESNLDSLDIQSSTNAAFFHINLNGNILSDNLNFIRLAIGGRYNGHSSFGKNYTYEINPAFMLNKNSMIYASWSTGFNAPSLYRLYSPQSNYISGITRGNTNLNPETSSSYEFGIKQNLKKFGFNISVFRTEIDNLIEYVYLWDRSIGIDTLGNDWLRDDYRGDTYINIGSQINKGFEISVRSKLNDKVTISGNISLVNGALIYNPDQNIISNDYHVQLFSTGDFLNKEIELQGLSRRSNTANLIITYTPFKKLNLRADIKHIGVKKDIYYNSELGPYGALGQKGVGEYTLFGFTAGYRITKNIYTTLRIDNLFDTEYQELIGYSTKGRGIYLKLTYSI